MGVVPLPSAAMANMADECWSGWAAAMRRRNLSEGTVQARCYELRAWSAFIGARWARASRRDVERYLDTVKAGRSARTRYCAVSTLHAAYLWAQREGLARLDPTVLVERPRLERRLPRPAREAEVAAAVGAGELPLEVCAALAAYQGLRCCELARLRWEDVDLAGGRLWIRGKGGKDRVERIARKLRPILQAHDGALGPVAGRPVTAARMSQLLGRHLRARGCTATAHQLRHRFGCVALEQTRDLAAVQRAMGHASITTTTIYAAVVDHVVDELFDRM